MGTSHHWKLPCLGNCQVHLFPLFCPPAGCLWDQHWVNFGVEKLGEKLFISHFASKIEETPRGGGDPPTFLRVIKMNGGMAKTEQISDPCEALGKKNCPQSAKNWVFLQFAKIINFWRSKSRRKFSDPFMGFFSQTLVGSSKKAGAISTR